LRPKLDNYFSTMGSLVCSRYNVDMFKIVTWYLSVPKVYDV